ncbi:hypothetical protein TTHERM_000778409 (macronuclear) [Tetrahymena thermophila SB210]|uniref:Uncharacterized protein n=1 Tax=Tetrahymena thermophila (strain SB210) TaxID=312017 RepID=W7X9M3_TETTS|nr:hypothetical protein TTHERM_000778409 [Tetrahymena thermophila SB210]EWS73103.1 hypothetical protein TTHERM_000778409 [Tetrahymena thermophila SB210]|eukprot:XP_012654374.1 hypothetical protein TTHERM_000778409 [Tetrahymena thermophila SB210]
MYFEINKIIKNDFINSTNTISVRKDIINRIINQFDSLGVLPLDTAKMTQQQTKLITIYKTRDTVLPILPFLNVCIIPKKAIFINELFIIAIITCQMSILQPQNNIEITNVCIVFKQSRVNLNGRERISSKIQKILKNQ